VTDRQPDESAGARQEARFARGQLVHVATSLGPRRAQVISHGPKWLKIRVAHVRDNGTFAMWKTEQLPADTTRVFAHAPEAVDASQPMQMMRAAKRIAAAVRILQEAEEALSDWER
jgi:hypothetical protein